MREGAIACAEHYFDRQLEGKRHFFDSGILPHTLHFNMFEARFEEGDTLIRIVDAMKELVEDCNIDCSTTGMSMQVSPTANCR